MHPRPQVEKIPLICLTFNTDKEVKATKILLFFSMIQRKHGYSDDKK